MHDLSAAHLSLERHRRKRRLPSFANPTGKTSTAANSIVTALSWVCFAGMFLFQQQRNVRGMLLPCLSGRRLQHRQNRRPSFLVNCHHRLDCSMYPIQVLGRSLDQNQRSCHRHWNLANSWTDVTLAGIRDRDSNSTTAIDLSLTPWGASASTVLQNDHEQPDDWTRTNWKVHPDLNPTVYFRSWIVPVSGKSIQSIVSSDLAQPFLATRWETFQHMHLRLKVVRDIMPLDDDFQQIATNKATETSPSAAEISPIALPQYKLILLHPDTPCRNELPQPVKEMLAACQVMHDGPLVPIVFSYHQFTASYILSKILPTRVHPPPTAFETVGHVAHLNLRRDHVKYKHCIGQVLLETLPNIETVIHKVGEVHGPHRTYDFEVLAGRPNTAVQLVEDGVQLRFDLSQVYWCSRLSEERRRLIRTEFQPYQTIADAFCGVGALCLQAARQLNCTIYANDWNPHAVSAIQSNVVQNGLTHQFKQIQCGNAYDFLMGLGLQHGGNEFPDHVLLNYPLEAPTFLGALRWWPAEVVSKSNRIRKQPKRNNNRKSKKPVWQSLHVPNDHHLKDPPRVHVYTFAKADPNTDRTAEDVAVDLVAANLLPIMGQTKKDTDDNPTSNSTTTMMNHNRTEELNAEYGCQVRVHPVRDVAPGKVILCVSFSATPRLLRTMQGDFR